MKMKRLLSLALNLWHLTEIRDSYQNNLLFTQNQDYHVLSGTLITNESALLDITLVCGKSIITHW